MNPKKELLWGLWVEHDLYLDFEKLPETGHIGPSKYDLVYSTGEA